MEEEMKSSSLDQNQTVSVALESQARDLAARLRGKYACGPLLANGEPEFGYREFKTLPDGKPFPLIHGEAADMIDDLLGALSSAKQVEDRGPGTNTK